MATKPDIITVPPPALRSDPTTFNARAEGSVAFFEPLVTYMAATVTYMDERGNEVLANSLIGDIPPMPDVGLNPVFLNQAGNSLEFLDGSEALAALGGTSDGIDVLTGASRAIQRRAIGLDDLIEYGGDIDLTTMASGQYRVLGGATGTKPGGVTAFNLAVLHRFNDSDITQIAYTNGAGTFKRYYSGASWKPWRRHEADAVWTAFDNDTGLIYDGAVDGTVAAVETPLFVDGLDYAIRVEDLTHDSAASEFFRLGFYQEPVAAWTSGNLLTSNVAPGAVSGMRGPVAIQNPLLARDIHTPAILGRTANKSWGDAFSVSSVSPSTVTKMRITANFANITGGTIRMFTKRSEFQT